MSDPGRPPPRFRRRVAAPSASLPWRWLLPIALVGAVVWSGFLLVEGARQVLDMRDGETREAIVDPTAAGFEAFVAQTWSMLIVTEDDDGLLTSVAVSTVADRQRGGGSVLVVPPELLVDSACTPPCSLVDVHQQGGVPAVNDALVTLFDVGFTEFVRLTPPRWAGLVGPVGVVEVPLATDLVEVADDGTEVVRFPAGETSVSADLVVAFVGFPDEGGGVERMERGRAFWRAWLEVVGEGGTPLARLPELELTVVDQLGAIASGAVAVGALPVIETAQGLVADPGLLASMVVDLFPFPIAAVPGDRTTVRLINGTGDFTLDPIARARVVAAGGEITVVGNHTSFDVLTSKVVHRDPALAEEAAVLADRLGIGVESDENSSPAADVTVLVGADFVASG